MLKRVITDPIRIAIGLLASLGSIKPLAWLGGLVVLIYFFNYTVMSLKITNRGNEPICLNYARLGSSDYTQGRTVDVGQKINEDIFMNYSDKVSVSYHSGRCGAAKTKPTLSACTLAKRWGSGMAECYAAVFPSNRYGNTTILNHDTDKGRHDVLRFAEGIDVGDISLIRRGDNLHLDFRGESEVITVLNYFKGDAMAGYALNAIEFFDGTSWDSDYVIKAVRQGSEVESDQDNYSNMTGDAVSDMDSDDETHYVYGEEGDDTLSDYNHSPYSFPYRHHLYSNDRDSTLYGYAGKDKLYGGPGADRLYGGADDDVLYGGDGDDELYGQAGADILHSNTVDSDYLEGGAGDDVYLFQVGALHCHCIPATD